MDFVPGGRLHVDVLLDERVRDDYVVRLGDEPRIVSDAADPVFVTPNDAVRESVLRQPIRRQLGTSRNQPVADFGLLDSLLVPSDSEVLLRLRANFCWIVGGMGSPSIWACATSRNVHARQSSL